MNKIFKYGLSFLLAIILITFIKPFIDDYKEQKQYDFKVTTIDGEITKDSLKGKYLAIYFGYTFCPDVCPTSLSSLSHALNSLPKEKTKDFIGLFISVDPDRDTLKNLKEYAQYFHPNFMGATTSKENIDDITSRYKSYYKKIELENSAMGYSVSHTSYIYIFDKTGKFRTKVDHFSDPTKIKKTLEEILE